MTRSLTIALLAIVGVACDRSQNSSRAEDTIVASDSGMTLRAEMHPNPEERTALARTLPHCSVPIMAALPRPGWRWQRVRPIAAELPMPVQMNEEPDKVPNDPDLQQWGLERWGSIVLMLDAHAQESTEFFIGGSMSERTTEPECSLPIGSYLSLIRRSASAIKSRHGSLPDTLYIATTDIPFALPDSQLGIGITANTRAGRDTLLSIVAALRFVSRSH